MPPALLVVAAFAVLTALLGWSRWLAGRRWAAAGHLLLACAAVAVAWGGGQLDAHLATYEVRRSDFPVAELSFERTAAHRYRVTLTRLPSGRMQVFELTGDEWRLDLRTVAWSPRAAQLGLAPRYRIERLASRPAQPAHAGAPSGVAHELAATDGPLPAVAALRAGEGSPLIATTALTGPWQPMAHGARFDIRLLPGDVVAVDPLNAAASDSLGAR